MAVEPAAQPAVALPPLRSTGPLYLLLLLVLAIGFYILLFASLAATIWALRELVIWTPTILKHLRGAGAFKLLALLYIGAAVFGWALLRAVLARTGGNPLGVRFKREDSPRIFALSDEVARQVEAKPIEEVWLTPEDEIGVWEQSSLFLPPGFGKRKLVLGMGALCYLTVEQLRSVLAHEYGHFSNRDTYWSRFVYRVSSSHAALMHRLAGQRIQFINPLFWLLRAYVAVYERIAARFSRLREYAADRFAVEAYGAALFRQALITAHLEGMFFAEVGIRAVVELAEKGRGHANVYHFVGFCRKAHEKSSPQDAAKVLGKILMERSKAHDFHPSLPERLSVQGVRPDQCVPSPTPCVACVASLEKDLDDEERTALRNGPSSAASTLLGETLTALQSEMSDLMAAKYQYIIEAARRAEER